MKSLLLAATVAFLPSLAAAQDWSGAYGGAALSYDKITVNDLSYGDGPIDLNGAGLGLFLGYNWQSGSLVFGSEIAATKHSGEASDGDYLLPATALFSVELRGRVGFATGKLLPYLAIGAVRTDWEADHFGSGLAGDMAKDTANGTAVAIGVDVSFTPTSFLRVEFEKIRYADDKMPFYNGSDNHDYEMDASRLTIGYAMRF